MEDKIKELEKQIESYKKKIQKSREKFEKVKEKHDKEIADMANKLLPLTEKHNALIIEQWVERGKQGLNKGLYSSRLDELPDAVRYEYYKIRDKIRGGCSGDWYDGCRGCDKNCESEAKRMFKEMFGF